MFSIKQKNLCPFLLLLGCFFANILFAEDCNAQRRPIRDFFRDVFSPRPDPAGFQFDPYGNQLRARVNQRLHQWEQNLNGKTFLSQPFRPAKNIGSQGQQSNKPFTVLSYPKTAQVPLNYQLNGTKFVLQPGERVLLGPNSEWEIEFSAGKTHGNRVAKLQKEKKYQFKESAKEGLVLLDVTSQSKEEHPNQRAVQFQASSPMAPSRKVVSPEYSQQDIGRQAQVNNVNWEEQVQSSKEGPATSKHSSILIFEDALQENQRSIQEKPDETSPQLELVDPNQ